MMIEYFSEIEKSYKKFEYRPFRTLLNAKLIDRCVFENELPDYDEYGQEYYPEHYRISDAGKAYLESRLAKSLPEVREWIAIAISIAALIISTIALIKG